MVMNLQYAALGFIITSASVGDTPRNLDKWIDEAILCWPPGIKVFSRA